MKHFIVFNPQTGAVLRAGTCKDSDLAGQARSGEAVMEATANAIVVAEVNLDPVRESASATIDAQAEAMRERLITPGSGQALTYMAKNAEALGVLTGSTADTPFLSAEAEALGMTVADLAADVRGQAIAWQTTGAAIEARRRKAKADIAAAGNVAEIYAATQVEWDAPAS